MVVVVVVVVVDVVVVFGNEVAGADVVEGCDSAFQYAAWADLWSENRHIVRCEEIENFANYGFGNFQKTENKVNEDNYRFLYIFRMNVYSNMYS